MTNYENNFEIFKSALNEAGLVYQFKEYNSSTTMYYCEHIIVEPIKKKFLGFIPITTYVPIAKIDDFNLHLAEKNLKIEITNPKYSDLIKKTLENFERKRLQTETIETKL